MFGDDHVTTKEIHFLPGGWKSFVMSSASGEIDSKPNDTRHAILKIMFKNDEEYALDLTCFQYGWKKLVVPWDEYKHKRIHFIGKRDDFGTLRSKLVANASPGSIARWCFLTSNELARGVAGWAYSSLKKDVPSPLDETNIETRAVVAEALEKILTSQSLPGGEKATDMINAAITFLKDRIDAVKADVWG